MILDARDWSKLQSILRQVPTTEDKPGEQHQKFMEALESGLPPIFQLLSGYNPLKLNPKHPRVGFDVSLEDSARINTMCSPCYLTAKAGLPRPGEFLRATAFRYFPWEIEDVHRGSGNTTLYVTLHPVTRLALWTRAILSERSFVTEKRDVVLADYIYACAITHYRNEESGRC